MDYSLLIGVKKERFEVMTSTMPASFIPIRDPSTTTAAAGGGSSSNLSGHSSGSSAESVHRDTTATTTTTTSTSAMISTRNGRIRDHVSGYTSTDSSAGRYSSTPLITTSLYCDNYCDNYCVC